MTKYFLQFIKNIYYHKIFSKHHPVFVKTSQRKNVTIHRISTIYTDRVSFSSFELFTSPCVISYTLYFYI